MVDGRNKICCVGRIVLLLALLVRVSGVCAQSERSNQLFAEGVELYQATRYAEAIPLFSQVDSLDRLDMDTTSARFGYGKHWMASCYHKMGQTAKAKSIDFIFYELPPVDRRLTEKSDSLIDQLPIILRNNKHEEALAPINRICEQQKAELGEDNQSSLNTRLQLCYPLAYLGRTEEAVSHLNDVMRDASTLFGEKNHYMLQVWRESLNIYAMAGLDEQIEATFDRIFSLLTELGDMDSQFGGEMLDVLGGYYAQTRRYAELDQVIERQLKYVDKTFGEKSINRAIFLKNMSELNTKLGRYEVALTMAEEAEELARSIEGASSMTRFMAIISRLNIYIATTQYKEARKCIKRCLKELDPSQELYTYATPSLISIMLIIQNVEGKLDRELLNEAQTLLNNIAEKDGKNNMAYAGPALLLAQALSAAGDNHQGAQLVSEILGTLQQIDDPKPLFYSCLVLLSDHQYVKARIASSYALERINRQLDQNYVAVIATECRKLADNGLLLIDTFRDEEGLTFFYSASDTTKYSLAMIQQDLLHSKLLTLEKMDSIETESFWQTLLKHSRTAFLATNDSVMADSVLNRYRLKMQEMYGEDSPQVQHIAEIRDRCQFEKYGDGWVKAYAITLREPGTPDYFAKIAEYEAAYEAWKQKRNGETSDDTEDTQPKEEEPKTPSIYNILRDKNYQEAMVAYDTAYRYYKDKIKNKDKNSFPFWKLSNAAAGWSLCADSLGLREQIAPRLNECWSIIKESNNQYYIEKLALDLLAQAWLHCERTDYLTMEGIVYQGMQDKQLELHAAMLLQAMNWLDDVIIYGYFQQPLTLARQELDSTIKQLESEEDNEKLTAQKFFIMRSMYLWSNYFHFSQLKREQLADDFVKILNTLKQHSDLQAYRESYDAMTMLCSIATDYNSRDYKIAVEADKMRKAIRKECTKQQNNSLVNTIRVNGIQWPTFQPIGQSFSIGLSYSRLDDKEEERLSSDLWFAYRDCGLNPDGEGEEKYDNVMAMWNEIRGLQRETFSNEEKIIEKIGKLTTQVCNNIERDSALLRGLAYDIALFGKGYLLRSDQQLRKVIMQSGNRSVLRRFEEYMQLMQQLDDTSLPESQASDIRQQAQTIWSELKQSSRMFDDYTKSLEASWREVQAALKDDEAAIEYIKADDVLGSYYALILRKGYDAPLVKSVGWENDILTKKDTLYKKGTYSELIPTYIFKPGGEIIKPLDGIKKLYLSPTGLLHQVALESLYYYGTDSLMSEKFDIYRLSSTRNLIGRDDNTAHNDYQEAILYGGITYDLDDDVWNEMASAKGTDQTQRAQRDIPRLNRGSMERVLEPLEGSREEVQQITSILTQEKVSTKCLTDQLATEEHMKGLSGTDATILHIATHGFTQTQEEVADSTVVGFTRREDSKEENALSRAGLFMAGASAVFYGTSIPSNVDDGVLTAREISHLDFTNLELVVLSACESGLGDITADGVFGLQRGFKKAGAGSILMSLWNVDDEATCLLMTEFYQNWIRKKRTKRDALELAKHTVRSHKEKGWDDPRFWAAFILLDGLE